MSLHENTHDRNKLADLAKENPDMLFHLHVGPTALSEVKAKSTAMGLNDTEIEAVRGMHLAIALDEYADMYHIGRLYSVPSRQELQLNMNKGESFWRGFQIARGEIVLKSGFRSNIQNEERLASWMYAKSLNYACAMEGFAFGASTDMSGTQAILSQILGTDDHASYSPSTYLESISDLVAAIERSDQSYFMAT
ncbi:hypothetical protein Q4577_02880 [Marinovum sp. 2_MG-2023]|uniref:hypothetical protein n=1 Tax=unclassified Marinovum TaxID=2647166 RepID=UPI0026E4817B|nr:MULTISPECIES: hypothetical protein [unclassified Marinovum]MDO6728945.1 hypothetical protein [Marinovum sp. 2_MG-2023]MDO6777639.1 hypothetical protein [Marinovum sp. 1_MG-2023]